MLAAYIELKKEEWDIGVSKDEFERERARDDPDQNKIKHLEEEIKQREESYFANQRRYRNRNINVKNQVERIISILSKVEKLLGDRLRELFKKEGITIASITTAIGLVISTIVLAVTRITNVTLTPTPPTPKPSPGEDLLIALRRLSRRLLLILRF